MFRVDTKRIAQRTDLVKDMKVAFKINRNRRKTGEHGTSYNRKIEIVPKFGVVHEVGGDTALMCGEATDDDVPCGGCILIDMGRSNEDAAVPNGKRGAVYIRCS